MEKVNLSEKFARFSEQWKPKVIAEMNDYQFKIARLEGDFIWHDHKNTDETFIVLEGVLRIDFRDGSVRLSADFESDSPLAFNFSAMNSSIVCCPGSTFTG